MSAREVPGPDGLLVVDKAAGWTSHDVVARCRRLLGTRRVGHAGTLDPMATGVLVLGVGRGTKLLTYVVGADKDYAATVVLGASTVTDDAEGEVVQRADPAAVAALTRDRLDGAVAALTGAIEQVPSAVSAIKVDGQRSYARVRAGQDVALAARPVTVSALDVLAVRPGPDRWEVDVATTVSSGTYVRALARDIGVALGVGGHLSALRRTRVGAFGLGGARTLDDLGAGVDVSRGAVSDTGRARAALVPLASAASTLFPTWTAEQEQVRRLRHGQRLATDGIDGWDGRGVTAVLSVDGDLVALVTERDGALRPVLVVPAEDRGPADGALPARSPA